MHRHTDPPPRDGERLVPLRSLPGHRLSDDEPDVRGWDVLGADGGRIGVVDELLVERRSAEVAALAVTAGRELVVVPMERAWLDDRRRVVATDVTREELASLGRAGPPAAAPATGDARAVAGHPGVTVERTADGEEVVRVPIVREELVVERRPVVKEVVVIRKRAAREERVVEADLRRERLEVERRETEPRDADARR